MSDFAQWFDALGKCRNQCNKPATGTLMSHRNEKLGNFCKLCADKLIKKAHRKGDFYPDVTLNLTGAA